MKKILPILLGAVVFLFVVGTISHVSAQQVSPVPEELEGKWVADPEVTFIGKTATRSNDFLNWTLQNYNWISVGTDQSNPLRPFWQLVAFTVYALMFLFVLATAFIMVITRGQNITIMRFVPRFVLLIILVTLSFSLVQFLYTIGDIIQGFLLKPDGNLISSKDLLFIDFDYAFTGYRLLGAANDESAFITLLLVKLTAITYYVMSGILIVRKIILWFFLVVSPILPLLILYRPIRNTAKIWVGEFFRWLLYAPLFALFLHGLVVMWRDRIPLPFNFTDAVAGKTIYPTAVNILIGGPGQTISITNSVNLRDTFAQYVVALLMLWVVILLPFLLLRIFLDYINTISIGNNTWVRNTLGNKLPFLGRGSAGPLPPPPPPGKVFPAGMAKQLPFMKRASTGMAMKNERMNTESRNVSVNTQVTEANEVLKSVNISIPKMADIAKYETAMLTKDISKTSQIAQFHETIEKIANPNIINTPLERERFSSVKERLVEQKSSGNPVANTVLTTINNTVVTQKVDPQEIVREVLKHLANPSVVVQPAQREKINTVKAELTSAKSNGDSVAATVLTAAEKIADPAISHEEKEKEVEHVQEAVEQGVSQGSQVAAQVQELAKSQEQTKATQSLPVINKVQQVSIEEFEEVRKMWVENYQDLEPPRSITGEQSSREEWISNDIEKINEAINLLNSANPEQVSEGMQIVSAVLPFLLMGGFSKSEVITYLKAKLEAGKQVIEGLQKKQEEEDTMLDARTTHAEKAQTMSMERSEEAEKPELKDLANEKVLGNEQNNGDNNQ